MTKYLFRLSLLSSALLSCHVFANEEAETNHQLEVIEVTAQDGTKTKTNVLTIEKQNKRTETDLRGLLNEEPSINFGGGNGTSQWMTIRGMGQDQIDVKVDGAYSDSQIFHHQGRFNLDPSLLKIVNVQKGAGSASAGIGATSGSITAKTVDALDLLKPHQNYGFKIQSGYASNDETSYGLTTVARLGQADVLVAGNWVNQDDYQGGKGYQNVAGSHYVKNSALDKRGLLAKIGLSVGDQNRFVLSHRQELNKGTRALREEFDFSQDRLAISALNAEQLALGYQLAEATGLVDRQGRATYYVIDPNGDYVDNDANNNNRYREYETQQTTLEWEGRDLGFIHRGDANVYVLENKRSELEKTGKRSESLKTIGANLNLDHEIKDNYLLKYGVNYRHQEGQPNKLDTGIRNQEKSDVGVYVEGIGTIGQFTITSGLRYDRFNFKSSRGKNVSDDDLNPSIGVIWQVHPHLKLNTQLNYATRSPRLYEIALSGNGNVDIADNVQAEHARNVEIGFNYDDGALSFAGNYFWQRVDDALGYRNTAVNGIREIANLGLVKNKGYELETAYRWNGLTARAGVAQSKPETYGNLGDSTLYAVQTGRTWTTGLSYRLNQPSLEIGWRGRFVESTTGQPSRGSSVSSSTIKRDGYSVNDFYANWQPLNNDRLNINFAVNNAFNQNYKPHSQRAGVNSLVGSGRDFRIGFNYTF